MPKFRLTICSTLLCFFCFIVLTTFVSATNITAPKKGLFAFMKNFSYALFPVDSRQPALVRAAATLVIDYQDRGNVAGLISSEGYSSSHQEHVDVINSFARRVSPIIALSVIDAEQVGIGRQDYKNPLNIFVVDGIDGFK